MQAAVGCLYRQRAIHLSAAHASIYMRRDLCKNMLFSHVSVMISIWLYFLVCRDNAINTDVYQDKQTDKSLQMDTFTDLKVDV